MPAVKSTIAIEHLKLFDINLDVYFNGPPRGFGLATRPTPDATGHLDLSGFMGQYSV